MPRRTDHQQRRTRIAYAVWAVIAEQGIESVSLRRVAAEAGISLGQVQYYFASKDELIKHACRTVIEISASAFAARTSDAEPLATARALITQPLPRDEVARIGTAVWQAFLTRAATDADLREIIFEAVVGATDELARLLRQAQRDGDLAASVEVEPAARALFAMSYGLSQQVMISALTLDEATAAAEVALAAITTQDARRVSR